MRRFAFSLVPFVALSCSPAAEVGMRDAASEHQAIINGESCTADVFPSALAILIDADIEFEGFGQTTITSVMCTGTLIAPDVVLTAAHCVDPTGLTFGFGTVTRADFYVSFEPDLTALANQGETPAPIPASAIPVREALAHPEFRLDVMTAENVNGPGEFKDVGLLFLDVKIEDIEPELVITEAQAQGALVVGAAVDIAGWGQQTVTADPFTPPPPGTVGKKICGTSTINEVGPFEMQIGADSSTTRKCHGDSGGPTYLVVDGVRRVVGITSHAYDAEDCNKGGVDTRVDVWLSWIEGEMIARCESGARVFCDVPGLPLGPGSEGEDADEDSDEIDINPEKKGCASAPGAPMGIVALALLLRRRKSR